jgi:hypothetical protein
MGKWLAIGALVLVVLLFVMWKQLPDSEAMPTKTSEPEQVAIAPSGGTSTVAVKKPVAPSKDEPATDKGDEPAKTETRPLDPASDLFYKHFLDVIPKRLWREASVCYEGKLGSRKRDAKIKLAFNVVAKGGKVTIQDVRIANDEDTGKPVNTINDPAIESCFFQKVARYSWDGNADMPEGYTLPDYIYPDELVIRPERSKKYYQDNLDYVGGEAPPMPTKK